MSETLEPAALSATESLALSALSRTFLAAARNAVMYPAEHPTVQAAVERFREAIAEAVDAKVAVGISVTPATLLVRNVPGPEDFAVAELAALLHGHGILQIGFDSVVPPDAVGRLLALVGRPPGSFEDQGGIAAAWIEQGHPSVRLEAIDYRKVLADRDARQAAPRHDDVWRSIVSAMASGRRTLDQREQKRLLELVEDPGEIAALAHALIAGKCTPDGAPLLSTQASTILASFRHLASIAGVLAPDRAKPILQNLATALLQLDPHVSLEVLSLEGKDKARQLGAALDEDALAQLLGMVLALEGQASPRVGQTFDLLLPDRGRRQRVLDSARAVAQPRYTGDRPFGAFWNSIEEFLLSYDDEAFFGNDHRTMLDALSADGAGRDSAAVAMAAPPQLTEWIETVGEDSLRQGSVLLLTDLLRMETDADRARTVLINLADLADHLLNAAAYRDALEALEAIAAAASRERLASVCAETLERVGTSSGLEDSAAVLGDLTDAEWTVMAQCFQVIGVPCLAALRRHLLAEDETVAAGRAGDACVAVGQPAVELLVALLDEPANAVRRRAATLLGRVASPAAVPALQALLRAPDPGTVLAAVRALAGINDPSAARAIHMSLASPDPRTRELILDALVEVADRRVVPLLARILQNARLLGSDYQVALLVLEALARVKDGRAVRAASAVMFLHGSWMQRCMSRRRLRSLKEAAARTLTEIGDAAAREALDRAGRSRDRMLRTIVRGSQPSTPAAEGAA